MRHLVIWATLLVLACGSSPAAEPTKAELEKKITECKKNVEKAAKEVEPFKKDKEIGAEVVKHLAAKEKSTEAFLKTAELQNLPQSAAVTKQIKSWSDIHDKKLKESSAAYASIEKISADKAKEYLKALEPYNEAQKALLEAQMSLIDLKASGGK